MSDHEWPVVVPVVRVGDTRAPLLLSEETTRRVQHDAWDQLCHALASGNGSAGQLRHVADATLEQLQGIREKCEEALEAVNALIEIVPLEEDADA